MRLDFPPVKVSHEHYKTIC